MRYPRDVLKRASRIRLLALDADGVLTSGGMWFNETGEEFKRFDAKDAHGLGLLLEARVFVALCSRAPSRIVVNRCLKWGVEPLGVALRDKREFVDLAWEAHQVKPTEIAFLGDDLPDIPLLELVGFAAATADAEDAVRRAAHWVTPRPGGRGAVRDVCNLLLAARQKK